MAACEEGDGNSDGRFDSCDRAGLLGPLLRAAFRGRFVPVFAFMYIQCQRAVVTRYIRTARHDLMTSLAARKEN